MKDIDKMLIGTSWARSKGQHNQLIGSIDNINDRGPRIKSERQSIRITWAELDFSWTPTDNRTQKAYDLWKLASQAEFLKEEIESEKEVKNGVELMSTPEVAVKECHGAWHRHLGKKDHKPYYDLLPLTSFSIARHGPNAGKLAAVCDDCKERNAKSPSHLPKVKLPPKAARLVVAPEPVKIEPAIATPEGEVYRWRVSVVQVVEHIIQGKDLLDVAAQIEGLGEVKKVEKL